MSHNPTAPGPADDGGAFAALADQHRAALERQHVMDARLFDYRSLLRAARALHHTRDLDDLLGMISAMVRDRLDVTDQWIFLSSEQVPLRFVQWAPAAEPDAEATAEPPEPPAAPFAFTLEHGIVWQLLCEGEPISVQDLSGRFRFAELFAASGLDQFPSVVWLPLVMVSRPLGLLALGPQRNGQPYDESQLEFLRTLGEQASVAIGSVSLWQQFKAEQGKLDRTIKHLSVLYDISRAVNRIEDMKSLLLEILDRAIERVGAQKGSVMLYEPASDRIKLQVVRGLPDRLAEDRINSGAQECKSFRPGEGIAGKVFLSKKYHLSLNAGQDEHYQHSERSNIASILCLPLVMNDEAIGVLNITNKNTGQFSSDDVEILTAIASQAAMTIEKADLYRMAVTDELTQLYVRRYLGHRLDAEVRRRSRYGVPLTFLMVDIDHFKAVNDTYGHDAGDAILKEVARALQHAARSVDVVARFGGEEFAVLMPETQLAGATCAAERYRRAVEELRVTYDDKVLQVTISVGVAEAVDPQASSRDLIRAADVALYYSKEQGRNRSSFMDPEAQVPRAVGSSGPPDPEAPPERRGQVPVDLDDVAPSGPARPPAK